MHLVWWNVDERCFGVGVAEHHLNVARCHQLRVVGIWIVDLRQKALGDVVVRSRLNIYLYEKLHCATS